MGDLIEKFQKRINPEKENIPLWSLTVKDGLIPKNAQYNRSFLVKKNDFFNLLPDSYLIYNPMNITLGAIDINNSGKKIAVSGYYIILKIKSNYSEEFVLNNLVSRKSINLYQRFSTGSLTEKQRLQYPAFSKIKKLFPDFTEQKKIGSLLSALNKQITLQQRKVNDLNSMKSALLQDVFPNTQGIKKIKLSTQEWNLQKISSIFKERNQRNKNGMLLSVSISKGIYPFSENDRKDNSSNDKSNYKEVKINDLAYNSMRMWQGAVGVSKYNGIVSPAYTVITPKKEENPNFYYYYFKNKRMLFNFRQHSQGLTSDTWNLKFPLFEKILIQVPSDKEEEQRVSSLFKQIDKSIELSKIQIKKLTSIKQFLLQNMFI